MTNTNTATPAAMIAIWIAADDDATEATGHAHGCDCTECCAIRVESVRSALPAAACVKTPADWTP